MIVPATDETLCAVCHEQMPASARFCLFCGSPQGAAAEVEIRKMVTMLFCDVAGSTAMGEELDPEAFRAVMSRYFAVARAAVEQHGGTVEKFVGDAVLVFEKVIDENPDFARRLLTCSLHAPARGGEPRRLTRRDQRRTRTVRSRP